jgi:hypothetical protein
MVMVDPDNPLTRLAQIIDYIEKVREELLTVQRSLEKLEAAESVSPKQRDISK